jgi:hypothetical protein
LGTGRVVAGAAERKTVEAFSGAGAATDATARADGGNGRCLQVAAGAAGAAARGGDQAQISLTQIIKIVSRQEQMVKQPKAEPKWKRKRSDVEIIQKAAERQAKGVRFPKPKVTLRRGFSRR